jgi:curved DNA-binding protein CbpA
MDGASSDPYLILGVDPGASDAELRAAYRRLVQLHHPDHNRGSAESARRFEAIQDAYARVRMLRSSASGRATPGAGFRPGSTPRTGRRTGSTAGGRPGAGAGSTARQSSPTGSDPNLNTRLAEIERELRAAREARDTARRAAREAAITQAEGRPSDEELGYIRSDDSFSKIAADAASELAKQLSDAREHYVPKGLSDQLSDARKHYVPKRLSDLIDELASKLTGDPPNH